MMPDNVSFPAARLAGTHPRGVCRAERFFWHANYPAPHNPLGAKGAGESGIIPVGGVVANAIAAAPKSFRVQPNELPLNPPRIWQAIRSEESAVL